MNVETENKLCIVEGELRKYNFYNNKRGKISNISMHVNTIAIRFHKQRTRKHTSYENRPDQLPNLPKRTPIFTSTLQRRIQITINLQ